MKERIIIDISRDEFDFIRGAIEQKSRTLLNNFDVCKEEANKEDGGTFSAIYQPSVFNQMLRKMVDEEYENKTTQVILNESQYRAMKESGIWDDPVKRANVLKMYAERQRLDSIDDAFDFAYKQFKEEQKKAPKRRGRPPVKKTVTRRKNVK